MKRLLVLLAAVIAPAAWAAPFIVADVVAGVSSCGVFLDTAPKVTVPAVNNECKFDVANVAVGSHTVRMTAIAVNDPVWGTQESAPSAAFPFTKPALPGTPSGLRLAL